jgi:hypothetical protein
LQTVSPAWRVGQRGGIELISPPLLVAVLLAALLGVAELPFAAFMADESRTASW